MITVKISDLQNKLNELIHDGNEYVDILILESEEFEGQVIPKTIHFCGYDGYGGGTDYDEIEHVEIDAFYKFDLDSDIETIARIEHAEKNGVTKLKFEDFATDQDKKTFKEATEWHISDKDLFEP